MTQRLVICGGGSLAVEVAALLRDLGERGRVNGDGYVITDVVAPGPVRTADLTALCSSSFTTHADIASISDRDQKEFIVCTGDPAIRHKIYRELVSMDLTLARIVHPMAYVAPSAVIGAGAIIYPGVFVGPLVQLGANVVLMRRSRFITTHVLTPLSFCHLARSCAVIPCAGRPHSWERAHQSCRKCAWGPIASSRPDLCSSGQPVMDACCTVIRRRCAGLGPSPWKKIRNPHPCGTSDWIGIGSGLYS